MREAVIVEAVRTPLGKRGGALKDVHPVDLLAKALNELFARTGVDPSIVNDNITGCVSQVGEQSINVGRNGDVRVFDTDEGLRETSLEKLGSLKPAFYNEEVGKRFPEITWVVTAGNSSQITDGASALLITSSEKARELGLKPRARFHTFPVSGADPILMP